MRTHRILRRVLLAGVAALLVLPSAGVSARTADAPSPGGFSSDNVEWLQHIPVNLDSAGARIKGDYFYITTSNGLTIYDISEPETPQRLGFLPLPQQPYFAEEDVDTNGDVLLISSFGTLYVVDVEDKSNPTILSQLDGVDQHTYSCVLDCTYAYGSDGEIISLVDPTKPKEVGSWTKGRQIQSTHDVTEVKRGFVLTSSQPMLLFDARKSPAKPTVVATAGNADNRFLHSNLWPRAMTDDFILVGGETSGPSCDESDGAFMTWSTKGWRKSHTFKMIDEFRVQNGVPTDGDAAANLYCTHWFTTRPGYRNGGLVAMAWYEHGTRFLRVSGKGKISEVGWFLPFAGSTSAAYWVNDEIVYAVDYNRGIDILRFTGK